MDLGAELVLCMRYLGLTTTPVYLDGAYRPFVYSIYAPAYAHSCRSSPCGVLIVGIKRLFAAQASDGSWGDYGDAH
eukprot:COSAG03_NODE_6067_length_1121_cov_0.828767_2_plen_75_part_01